jgi:choline dehydrogenase-like flavoprotein
MTGKHHVKADIIVVGSGPGGATLARELSRQGKRVLILERGYDHRGKFYYGTYLGALKYSERMALLYTREGLNIVAPIMVGGATNLFTACSAFPPSWFKTRYGVDIEQEAHDTIQELDIKPLPEHLCGKASTRIAQAAGAIGYDWFPQPKFMHPENCVHGDSGFTCTAKCMLGCRCGAKWTAAEWIDEAVQSGADLRTSARVRRVCLEDGQVTGVEGWIGPRKFKALANTVVLAAGGIGTPRILQGSGFHRAGIGMTMDTTVMVYGRSKWIGTGNDPPMTWSYESPDGGYMLSTLTDPFLLYPLAAIQKGLGPALMWLKWHRLLGIMIKLKDDISGGIYPDGKIRKPLTAGDNQRLQDAYAVCRRILTQTGADDASIFMRPFVGTHPSGTVRIGEMLDSNLQTEVDGLYVCDASVFPESLDRPTVLTIISLAKRLAKHLSQSDG